MSGYNTTTYFAECSLPWTPYHGFPGSPVSCKIDTFSKVLTDNYDFRNDFT